jgi:signal transduction histidine kinase
LLLSTIYWFRLQQLEGQYSARLEERVGERTRIARELHDTLLQSFHGLLFRIQAARNMLPKRPEEALEALDRVITRGEQAITEGRDTIQDLRAESAARDDLENLLTVTCQDLASAQGADFDSPKVSVTVEGARRALAPILQDEIYRIARELLRNAFVHAGARQIETEIRYDDRMFRLRIRDDGKGIDPEVLAQGRRPGHWGLSGVRERAKLIGARLEIWSELAKGTEAELTIPSSVAYGAFEQNRGFAIFRKARKS